MPVAELAQHFSDSLGAPTKELYSLAALVFLADFFGWTAQEAAELHLRTDVQYALNLEPGAAVSVRTVERYQKLFREDHLAARVFEEVTTRLIKRSISMSPDSGSTRPMSSATWPASDAPNSWPWRSSGS